MLEKFTITVAINAHANTAIAPASIARSLRQRIPIGSTRSRLRADETVR
ncbi:hypothetical protein [Hyphomicrobium sp.]